MARVCRPHGYWVADDGSKTFDEASGDPVTGGRNHIPGRVMTVSV